MNWLKRALDSIVGVKRVEEKEEESDPVFPRVTPAMAAEILFDTGYSLKRGAYIHTAAKTCCAAGLLFIADYGAEEAERLEGDCRIEYSTATWPPDYALGLEAGFEGWAPEWPTNSLHSKGYADGVALQALEAV